MPLDPLAKITYGLFVAATKDGSGRDVGCIVNTACQVTVTPTMISLTVNKMNYTAGSIEASGVHNRAKANILQSSYIPPGNK